MTASAPISLIFSTLQPGSISAIGPPTLFLGLPDFSTRTSIPLCGGMASGGDRRPGAVVGVDQDARGRRGHLPHHVELGLDDLLVGRLAVLPLGLEGLRRHLDHRAVLVEGQHGQRPVRVADPLQAPELAGRQPLAQQGRGAQAFCTVRDSHQKPASFSTSGPCSQPEGHSTGKTAGREDCGPRQPGPYDEDRPGRYRVAEAWAHRAGSVRSSPQSERTSRLDPCLLVQGPRPGWMMASTIPIASPQYAGPPASVRPPRGTAAVGRTTESLHSWRPPLASSSAPRPTAC